MLRLILGRQGSGKTNRVYREIGECTDAGEENLILIVPEQFTLQAERELVEELNSSGIIDVEVLSFSRLSIRIMEERGELSFSKASKTGRHMILQKSLLELRNQLISYSGMIDKSGFIDEMQELISNLKKRMISEDAISSLIENELVDKGILCEKLNDINKIYIAYNIWMENYLDNEEILNYIISVADDSQFLKSSKIWIDGFHTFTEQYYCLISKFLKNSREVTITLTQAHASDRDSDIFRINSKTREKLIDLTDEKYKLIECTHDTSKSVEIKHLERELYAYPSEDFPDAVGDFKIHYYKNIYDELDGLCINIIKLVQRDHYRWRDIKVATNDLDTYAFLIERAFQEYGIPLFMDSKRKISDKPLSILLINTLNVIAYNFRYEDVFALIKTGLTDLEYEDYEILENYVLKYGIKGNQWNSKFNYIQENDTFDLDAINKMRESVISPILQLYDDIENDMTFGGICSSIFNYLKNLNVESKFKEIIWELKGDYSQREYASEVSQIYNIIIDLLDEIVEVFGEKETSIREFTRILGAGIESVDLAIIPSSLDQVLVGDITRSRSAGYKILFVIGANEGKLPSVPSTKGLLSEYENQFIRECGLEIDDDIGYKVIQENYLIYNQISKADEKIYMSYPLADIEGTSLRPSSLINRMQEIFPNLNIEKGLINSAKSITNAKGTLKHLINHFRSSTEGVALEDSIWDEVYKWYQRHPKWTESIENIKDAMIFDNQVGTLDEENRKSLYGNSMRTSVTRLEEYANCPFKHFVTYGLKPQERKVHEISIPDLGEILHRLIYNFSIRVEADDLDWRQLNRTEIDIICREVLQEFVSDYRQGILISNPKYQYLTRYVRRTFLRSVEILVYHYRKGKFNVAGNELIFGVGKQIPPIKIELFDRYALYLEGRIDRVDILKENKKLHIKVMDFKTGNSDLSLQDVYYGLSLQLLVYMLVCLNYGKKKDIDISPAGMFYFKLQDPLILSDRKSEEEVKHEINKNMKLKGLMLKDEDVFRSIDDNVHNSDVLNFKINKDGSFKANSRGLVTGEQLNTLISHTKDKIAGIGQEIFDGNISINPSKIKDKEACNYCQYKSICIFDRQLTANKFNRKQALNDQDVFKLLEGK